MDTIKVQGRRFVDEQGRERIFRGLNFPMGKTEPPTLEESFFVKCRDMGFNMLRLGPCWSKIEPAPGQYDEDYLRLMDEIFDYAQQYGMYVFLDMHQDLYSDFGVNIGDGAPEWAILTDGYSYTKPKLVWAEGYFWGKGVHRAFDHFWNNDAVHGKGLQDHFAAMWQMLARRYADHPAFFGFDFFNEPFPGTLGGRIFRTLVAKLLRVCAVSPSVKRVQFLKDILDDDTRGKALDVVSAEVMSKVAQSAAGMMRKFDTEMYQPFINRMQKAVREVTPNGVIMLEHCYYSNLGIPFSGEIPEGEEQGCFSPHGYDFFVDTPLYDYASNERLGFIFREARRSQERMNVPVIVGEWGSAGSRESTQWLHHIEFLQDMFDSYGWSDTYWAYWHGLFDWEEFMQVLSRPYPAAVNGTLEKFQLNRSTKTCTLWITPPPPGDTILPTEIYLPNGYESVDAGAGAKVTMNGKILQVTTAWPKIVVQYN